MEHRTSSVTPFDRYAGIYEKTVNRSLRFLNIEVDYFTRVKAAYLLDLLQDHFGHLQSVNLLDVGCGTGALHSLILDRLGSLSGVDVSRECLARATARNPGIGYTHFDGGRLPFADGSFEAVTSICVMHHVWPGDWPVFAAELRRVLKPGGLVVIFEHNPRNPLTRRVVSNCDFDRDAVLLRMGQVRELLSRAGLKDIRSNSILSIPSFGRLTRSIDLFLGHVSLGAQYFVRAVA